MSDSKAPHLKIFELFGTRNQNSEEQIKIQFSQYKCLVQKLRNSSQKYSKISKSFAEITSNINFINSELSQEDCPQISQKSALIISQILTHQNSKISQTLSQYSNRIDCFLGMYTSVLKKKYEKFIESLENVEHYREKVKSLGKVQKQRSRYERNRTKLDSAEEQFKKNSETFSTNLQNVINEGTKMLSQCFQSYLVAMVKNYQNLEENLNENISLTCTESYEDKKYSDFFCQERESEAKQLSFQQRISKFINKNYGKEQPKFRIKIQQYFKNTSEAEKTGEKRQVFNAFENILSKEGHKKIMNFRSENYPGIKFTNCEDFIPKQHEIPKQKGVNPQNNPKPIDFQTNLLDL